MKRGALGILCAGLLFGCGQTPSQENLVSRRDSLGIMVVEHSAFPQGLPRLHLDLPNAMTFQSTSTGLDLFGVRGAFRQTDHTVIVGDGGNFRILRFSPDGEVLSSVGRSGQGPGEFQHFTLISPWPSDSLIAWDRNSRRISVFSPEVAFVRSFSLARSDSVRGGFVRSVFEDGSFFATGFTDTGGQVTTGRHRFPSPAYHFGPDGTFLASFGPMPGTEIYFEAIDGGFRTTTALFSRSTERLTSRNQLVLAANDSYEFIRKNQAGELVQIVRLAKAEQPVTPQLRRQAESAVLDQVEDPDALARLRTTLSEMPVPETLPAYGRVFADRDGRVWIEEYQVEYGSTSEWHVFGSDGAVLFSVEMPTRFKPTDAGSDYCLGIMRDEFDVESVILASLVSLAN